MTDPDDLPPPGEPGVPAPREDPPPRGEIPPGPVMDTYLLEKAKALQAGGHFEQAERCYRQLLERDPKSVRALNNLGVLYETQKRMTEAEWAYRRAIEVNPTLAPAHYNLGHALQVDGRLDQAEQCYRRVLSLDPWSFAAHFNLGRLFEDQGRLGEAESHFRRAVEIVPESPAAHSCLGEALYRLGRFEDALASFERSIAIEPIAASEHFRAGKTLDVLGRLADAAVAYRRSIEIEPNSPVANENLVRALERLGRFGEAVQALAEWQSRAPEDPLAAHLFAALTGADVPERASDDCVRETFDRFASDYDATLERLGYRGPALIGIALAKDGLEAAGALEVLDAGCGTGLCAEVLRPHALRLVGVDLSAAMLSYARRRGAYDELVERELVAYLDEHPDAFDLVAGGDTLIYFGALEPVLAAAARALRPGGRLVFTLEQLPEGESVAHRIAPSGRYQHSETYVRGALQAGGLTPRLILHAALRHEGGSPVPGLVVLAGAAE